VLPPPWIDMFRTGTELQLAWLKEMTTRTRAFLEKIPTPKAAKRRAR